MRSCQSEGVVFDFAAREEGQVELGVRLQVVKDEAGEVGDEDKARVRSLI